MHRNLLKYRYFTALCVVVFVYLIPRLIEQPARASDLAPETSHVAAATLNYQPELLIKTPTDIHYQRENSHNASVDHTCAQIASPGAPAIFQIRLHNAGNVQDTFFLTCSNGGDENIARCFDATGGGQEITEQITGEGWTSPVLASGASMDLRLEVTLDPLVLLATPEAFSVTAVSCTNADHLDTVTAMAFKLPLISLQLLANPATAAVNTPVTLTAMPLGGVNLEYKYRVGYQDAQGWHWSDLRGFSPEHTCIWMPGEARSYTVLALVREKGSSIAFQTYASLSLTVRHALSTLALHTSPVAPQTTMTPVMLSALATGGVRVEYQFKVSYHDATGWHSLELRPYSPVSSCLWLPDVPRTYLLTVSARESGYSGPAQVTHSISYRINP